MILDYHDRWVIVTPTKTGTTSLTALLTRRVRSCGVQLLPKHGPQAPEKPADRIMTVRHPLDRFCSMYYHLQREGGRGRAFALESIDAFAEQVVAHSQSEAWDEWSLWSWPLSRYIPVARVDKLFDVCIDGGDSLCAYLSSTYGYEGLKMPHLRESKDRDGWRDTIDRMHADTRDAIIEWARPDMALKPENLISGYET